MYECEICDKKFLKEKCFLKHQCIWHCIDCCMSFDAKHVYKRHLKSASHLKMIQNTNVIQCEKCNKAFSSISNRNKHMKVCSAQYNHLIDICIHDNKCVVCQASFDPDNTLSMAKHIKKHLKHINVETIAKLRSLNDEECKDQIQSVTGNGNTVNSYNSTTNVTNNNITNNIVIFGNEDFSYISKKDIQEALKTKNVLPRLCKLMRNNPNHPENRNIRVTDYSRGKTRVYTENGWTQAHPIDTFNNMILEASEILDTNTSSSQKNFYADVELNKVDSITDNAHELDKAVDNGDDTQWGKENRREIMMEFV